MASRNTRIDAGRSLKRRKTRKGTRSCWECKRRKVKCTYASPAEGICVGCARRCLDCVGQEFPEQDPGPSPKGRLVGDRIGRLESMIQQLTGQVGAQAASPSPPSVPSRPPSTRRLEHQTLSQTLLAAYPSPSDLSITREICGNLALYLTQTFVTPSHLLEKRVALESERLWQQYTAETHPVLIARKMLLLACVLQHMHAVGPTSNRNRRSYRLLLGELSRPPRALAGRLAEAATTLVTAHDRCTSGTLEGLECLWLEAVYHEHNGSPRLSWLACRRAISAAHLMGFGGRHRASMALPKSILPQPDGETADLQKIWTCLVHSELALCLALGIPPSASCPDDASISTVESATLEDDASHTTKLERRHAAIATHLIRRVERDPDFEDLDAALHTRNQLEEAATAMPSGWWLMSNLPDPAGDGADNHIFESMVKLKAQIFHSYLLLLTHLPYMLQKLQSEPTTATTSAHHHHHDHTRDRDRDHLLARSSNACVEASRDLLRRFIRLRSRERAAGCFRLLDHYAWHAAAALLIARLLDRCQAVTETSPSSPGGGTDHQQRLSDRDLASEAMGNMRLEEDDGGEEDGGDGDLCYYTCSPGGAAAKSSQREVLRQLLALEAGGDAVVVTYCKPGRASSGSCDAVHAGEDQGTLVLSFPFAGHVSIGPQSQHGSAVSGGCSLLSGTMGCFPVTADDTRGEQGFDGLVEDDVDEEKLTKAMELRRRPQDSPVAFYLCMLRPVR